jgi:hypothetical protein
MTYQEKRAMKTKKGNRTRMWRIIGFILFIICEVLLYWNIPNSNMHHSIWSEIPIKAFGTLLLTVATTASGLFIWLIMGYPIYCLAQWVFKKDDPIKTVQEEAKALQRKLREQTKEIAPSRRLTQAQRDIQQLVETLTYLQSERLALQTMPSISRLKDSLPELQAQHEMCI